MCLFINFVVVLDNFSIIVNSFNEVINCVNARDYLKLKYIEMDHFVHEDVDLAVIFGRMDDAKLDLKKEQYKLKF